MGFVACESIEFQQDSARQGQGSGRPERSKHPTRYWLGNRQPDRWREQQEAGGGGHDDALDRLIRAQDAALKGAAGRAVKEEPCLLIRNGLSCWLNCQAALEAGGLMEQAETSQYPLQNITAIQSIMNMDVTCYLANLAIYGIDCTYYKTSLDLSGYEMELTIPRNKIKDGVAEIYIKNVPEENIERLKSIIYCLADLFSFSTTAQVRFCRIKYGNTEMSMGKSGVPARSKIFDTPSCIKYFVEKCWNTYIELREKRELKVVIEMLVSIDLVNLPIESKLSNIFILLENLKHTYAKDKGYHFIKGHFYRDSSKKEFLGFKNLLEEMFKEYGINDDLTNVVNLRNDIIHQGLLREIPFKEQKKYCYFAES